MRAPRPSNPSKKILDVVPLDPAMHEALQRVERCFVPASRGTPPAGVPCAASTRDTDAWIDATRPNASDAARNAATSRSPGSVKRCANARGSESSRRADQSRRSASRRSARRGRSRGPARREAIASYASIPAREPAPRPEGRSPSPRETRFEPDDPRRRLRARGAARPGRGPPRRARAPRGHGGRRRHRARAAGAAVAGPGDVRGLRQGGGDRGGRAGAGRRLDHLRRRADPDAVAQPREGAPHERPRPRGRHPPHLRGARPVARGHDAGRAREPPVPAPAARGQVAGPRAAARWRRVPRRRGRAEDRARPPAPAHADREAQGRAREDRDAARRAPQGPASASRRSPSSATRTRGRRRSSTGSRPRRSSPRTASSRRSTRGTRACTASAGARSSSRTRSGSSGSSRTTSSRPSSPRSPKCATRTSSSTSSTRPRRRRRSRRPSPSRFSRSSASRGAASSSRTTRPTGRPPRRSTPTGSRISAVSGAGLAELRESIVARLQALGARMPTYGDAAHAGV